MTTLVEIIDRLHPLPGPLYQRLVVEGPASSDEDYFRLYNGRWEAIGAWFPGKGPGIAEHLAANNWSGARVRFSPNLSLVPNASEMAPQDVVAVRVPYPLAQPERVAVPAISDPSHGFHAYADFAEMKGAVGLVALEQKRMNDTQSYAPASAAGVLAKLCALACPPCIVVNERDALVAMWRLAERVNEPMSPGYRLSGEGMPVPDNTNRSRFGLVSHRLAMKLGGDVNAAARPFALLIDAPGTRRTDITVAGTPVAVVTADVLHNESVSLEQLEALALVRG